MNCHKCHSSEVIDMYEESFECECGNVNVIGIKMCGTCNLVWRTYNNQVLESSEIHFDDFLSNAESVPSIITSDESDVLKNMEKELLKVDRVRRGEAESMSDYIHNCLRCGSVAHEEKDGMYKCGECNFEWEVVSFD